MKKVFLIPREHLSPALEELVREGARIAERELGVPFVYSDNPLYRFSAPIIRKFGIVHRIYPFEIGKLKKWGLIKCPMEHELSQIFGIVGRLRTGIAVGENATPELVARTFIHESGHEVGIGDCLSLPKTELPWGRIERGELISIVRSISSEEVERMLDRYPTAIIVMNYLEGKQIECRALFPHDVRSLCIMAHPFQSSAFRPAKWSEEIREEWRRAVGGQSLCEKCYSFFNEYLLSTRRNRYRS